MSGDKLRRVSTFYPIEDPWNKTDRVMMVLDPNGTHALVPWEVWERVVEAMRKGIEEGDGSEAIRILAELTEDNEIGGE